MKRTTFQVTLFNADAVIDSGVAFAFNSAIRKSEELVRRYARAHNTLMHGATPVTEGEKYNRTGYTREWSDGTVILTASVRA